MPDDTRNKPEIENFIKDFMANQKALDNAATPEERQKINNRFETYIEGQYDVSVQRQGRQAIDAMREPKAEGGFPDLNKDGEVTQADVLMGRGVDLDREGKAEGGVSEEINQFLDKKSPFSEKTIEKFKEEGKTKEDIRRLEIELFSLLAEDNPLIRDLKKELKEEKRDKKAEGSMMVPPEMEMTEELPVDTYDNISPEEEMQQAEDMLPDDEMEEEFVDYVAEEVLEPEEQEYLFKVLDDDPKLEGILDKIILSSTEFSGAGEVEGPGTGISDSIPARLSDGEFVFTRKATDQLGADNLQVMMDDAERAYDGGLMAMAEGGMPVEGMERYDMEKDDEEVLNRQMSYANRMPSLMNR